MRLERYVVTFVRSDMLLIQHALKTFKSIQEYSSIWVNNDIMKKRFSRSFQNIDRVFNVVNNITMRDEEEHQIVLSKSCFDIITVVVSTILSLSKGKVLSFSANEREEEIMVRLYEELKAELETIRKENIERKKLI